MIRWITTCLMILTVFFTLSAEAKTFDQKEFEAFIAETMDASTIPGLAVILFEGDGIVYEKAFGITGPDKRTVTLDTPFQLGSVSKSFAALLIVQLAAERRLDLDASLITYLPDFRTRDKEVWKTITVRHILSHRSGISTFTGNLKQGETYRGADALDLAVRDLRKTKLALKPGTQLQYSNANYILAAAVIEAITGKPYETVMDERVFNPLGMTNSYVQVPLRETTQEATGYRQWFGRSKAYPFIPGRAMMAAGGVTSSANDLAIYVKAIADKDPRIMPAGLSNQLIASHGEMEAGFGYGLGWMLWDGDGRRIVFHSGLNAGFTAQAGFYPDDKSGGLVLVNQSGGLQADVANAVLRKGLGLDPGPSRPTTGQKMTVWGLLATVIILLFSSILSTLRFSAYAKRAERVTILRRVLPALALFALAYGLAVIIPKTQGINLMGIRGFNPDIWLCLTLSAAIAVIWGITRVVYPYKGRTESSE